jgi:hypothetical protein
MRPNPQGAGHPDPGPGPGRCDHRGRRRDPATPEEEPWLGDLPVRVGSLQPTRSEEQGGISDGNSPSAHGHDRPPAPGAAAGTSNH